MKSVFFSFSNCPWEQMFDSFWAFRRDGSSFFAEFF
jgi:hypothetical protein